jgi:Leucine-rich repeat (LRR) protein
VEDESDSNTDDVEVQDAADESEIAHEVVVWSDPIIEQAVREGLDRPEGDIYADELSEIKILTIAEDQVIRAGTREDDFEYTINTNEEWETKSLSLEDLKWLPNLEDLYIRGYILNDLELIGNLTYLSNLKLENNDLSDISALSSLSNLEVLDLEDNNIRDISALSGLVNLEGLFLIDSNISDISALSGLVNLEGLWL